MGSIISQSTFGTWNCNAYGEADCSNTIITTAYFLNVGNIVQCTIGGTSDFNFVGGTPLFSFNLPILATDPYLTGMGITLNQRTGLISYQVNGGQIVWNDNLNPSFSGNLIFSATFTYRII